MNRIKALTCFLLVLSLLAAPALTAPDTPALANTDAETLKISGDGVAKELVFTRDELEKMSMERHVYSAINSFPTERVDYAAGIPLLTLLEQAGLKESARLLTFIASDGLKQTFTISELFEPRFLFAADGAKIAVPALVCLEYGSGGFDQINSTSLRLVMGQRAKSEQNNPWFVRFLTSIEVSTDAPEAWPAVTHSRTLGPEGVTLVLDHPDFDSVKIYYTTDGSAPTVQSRMYNISATRFQPLLNKPLLISRTTVVRAIAIGAGKSNSTILSITITLDDTSFNDLAGYEFAAEAIEELAKKAIVNGVGNNRFNPGGSLTRATFVTMLGRALNPDAESPPPEDRRFGDVNYDSWYGLHIAWAVDNGIVTGYPNGTFRPNTPLFVKDMQLMAQRAGLTEDAIPELGDINKTATRAQAAIVVYALMMLNL